MDSFREASGWSQVDGSTELKRLKREVAPEN